jgi:hypothetical protein|tara:strand:- start:500 stop:1870 length:1371 start_codon:yes stop_codon:yes gene_type:complete
MAGWKKLLTSGDIVNADLSGSAGITSANIADGTIDAAALGADCVTAAKIGDDVINSEHYAAGSIDNEHLAANSVDSAQYVDDSIDNAHIADDAVEGDQIRSGQVSGDHLAADCITAAKIADNAIGSEHLEDDAVGVAELSASGTASSSTFLRGDNTWSTPSGTNTEEVQDIVGAMFTSNTETKIAATYDDGDGTIDLVVDDMTANDNTWRGVTAGGNSLASNETLAFTAGTGISISESAGAVTITNSISDTNLTTEEVQDIVGAMFTGNTETKIAATYQDGDGTIDLVVDDMTANDDVDVSVANLKTRLAGGFGSNAVTIGDSDDVVTIGNDLVVTGDLTVSGDTTTLNIDTLSVEDKLVILSSGSGGGSTSNANASGLVVNTDQTNEPTLKWYETAAATGGPFHWAMTSRNDASTIGLAGIQVEVTSGSPSGLETVGGLFAYNSADGTMYFYNAV